MHHKIIRVSAVASKRRQKTFRAFNHLDGRACPHMRQVKMAQELFAITVALVVRTAVDIFRAHISAIWASVAAGQMMAFWHHAFANLLRPSQSFQRFARDTQVASVEDQLKVASQVLFEKEFEQCEWHVNRYSYPDLYLIVRSGHRGGGGSPPNAPTRWAQSLDIPRAMAAAS
jgi:hypothetical protein